MDQVEEIPFKKRLILEEPFRIGGGEFSAREILDKLGPLVVDERMARMSQVVSQRTYNIAPVLENIYDRGNISAVMRSAEAFGFLNFNIVEQPGAYFKNSNRVSQGTDKWLDIQKFSSTKECVESLRSRGFKIYCTHLEASVPIDEVDFLGPTAVVLGNEKEGVSSEMVGLADENFILPMQGFAQSFNISVAGALTFYHIYQRRKKMLGDQGDLSEKEREILLANYVLRTVSKAKKVLNHFCPYTNSIK